MPPLRIFVAGLFHETNSFSPLPTSLRSYQENGWYRPPSAEARNEALAFAGYVASRPHRRAERRTIGGSRSCGTSLADEFARGASVSGRLRNPDGSSHPHYLDHRRQPGSGGRKAAVRSDSITGFVKIFSRFQLLTRRRQFRRFEREGRGLYREVPRLFYDRRINLHCKLSGARRQGIGSPGQYRQKEEIDGRNPAG